MLKQTEIAEAYSAYRESVRLLSDLANRGDSTVLHDLSVVNSQIAHLREVSKIATVAELIVARILTIKGTEGATREVTIDRGSDDGVMVGQEAGVLSMYSKNGDHERKVETIGEAQIINTGTRSATVKVTMDKPSGDGLVLVGDMVVVKAKVPALPERSILWQLAKYHINFSSEDGKRIFGDYRMLYAGENEQLVEQELDAMLKDIPKTAEVLADREVMSKKLTDGRFKDKTLKEVMANPARADLQDFLEYVMKYPATYYKDETIGRSFGIWVLQGTPQ